MGTNTPVVLVLNLMDVAEKKGIHIDIKKLGERLGIPVVGFVASEVKRYRELKQQLADAIREAKIADSAQLMKFYERDTGISFKELAEKQKEERLFTKEKLAVSELERTDQGLMISGKHKYEYIDELLKGVVSRPDREVGLKGFDKKALGKHSGKWMAIGIIVAALAAAMVLGLPV